MIPLSFTSINLRILLALVIGISIGYERKIKGHAAGIRTNVLVCLGACIMSLIQINATNEVLHLVKEFPEIKDVLSTDISRIIAQIISGIGFLGAGTILVTKNKKISGLTSAATIWSVAGLGIATGMGYYYLAITGTITILLVLSVLKKVFKEKNSYLISIESTNYKINNKNLIKFFDRKNLILFDMEYKKRLTEDGTPLYQIFYFVQSNNLLNLSDLTIQIIKISPDVNTIKASRF